MGLAEEDALEPHNNLLAEACKLFDILRHEADRLTDIASLRLLGKSGADETKFVPDDMPLLNIELEHLKSLGVSTRNGSRARFS